MARRAKEEIRKERNEKRLDELIQSNKFFREEKYYKNNYWSWAAWDSWAAKGQAGSCGCGCGYYNGTLHNKRKDRDKGRLGHSWLKEVSPHLCSSCISKIEEKINHKFQKY